LPETFSTKLERAFSSHGQLCVGIDPHQSLLEENGLEDNLYGLETFASSILEAATGRASIVKFQVSFFERFGPDGLRILQQQLVLAKQAGLLVIADAKRGDIGTTMQAYADAWLGQNAPFMCDALTVNPFLGVGSLQPAIALAAERGKGLFVLCATSNPEAAALQGARTDGSTVSSAIADEVAKLNSVTATTNSRFGTLGLVVGATIDFLGLGLENLNSGLDRLASPILAPGFGAQGIPLSKAKEIFSHNSGKTIFSVSRSLLRDGLANVSHCIEQDVAELKTSLAG